jgi:hypothetical protein
VELYEQIRREYEHGAGTIRAVARKLGVHRVVEDNVHPGFREYVVPPPVRAGEDDFIA